MLLRLSDSTPSIKHFVDLIYDVEPSSIDMDNLKAIIRDKAWQELPEALTLKERPTFSCLSQFCVLPQTNGKLCVLKHYYVKSDKVKGTYVAKLVRGQGKEIAWLPQQTASSPWLPVDVGVPGWASVSSLLSFR